MKLVSLVKKASVIVKSAANPCDMCIRGVYDVSNAPAALMRKVGECDLAWSDLGPCSVRVVIEAEPLSALLPAGGEWLTTPTEGYGAPTDAFKRAWSAMATGESASLLALVLHAHIARGDALLVPSRLHGKPVTGTVESVGVATCRADVAFDPMIVHLRGTTSGAARFVYARRGNNDHHNHAMMRLVVRFDEGEKVLYIDPTAAQVTPERDVSIFWSDAVPAKYVDIRTASSCNGATPIAVVVDRFVVTAPCKLQGRNIARILDVIAALDAASVLSSMERTLAHTLYNAPELSNAERNIARRRHVALVGTEPIHLRQSVKETMQRVLPTVQPAPLRAILEVIARDDDMMQTIIADACNAHGAIFLDANDVQHIVGEVVRHMADIAEEASNMALFSFDDHDLDGDNDNADPLCRTDQHLLSQFTLAQLTPDDPVAIVTPPSS
jgi:hypothetical protein